MKLTLLSPDNIVWEAAFKPPKRGIVICDARLYELYPAYFPEGLPRFLFSASEEAKSLQNVQKLYRFFSENELHRSDSVHVFGGGISCDITAFAASTFKRGCRLWLYPSSLLAMVDAAIGGKTAVNHLGQRNLIGSFYPAEKIILHPAFLSTLPEDELRQGKAEMLKAYLIDSTLSKPGLKAGEIPPVQQILKYARFKMGICAQDPFDMGLRRVLNLGHSFGHCYEKLLDYRYGHGDCVIAGIWGELILQKASLPLVDYLRIMDTLAEYPLPKELIEEISVLDKAAIRRCLSQDKKADAKGLKLPKFKAYRQVTP